MRRRGTEDLKVQASGYTNHGRIPIEQCLVRSLFHGLVQLDRSELGQGRKRRILYEILRRDRKARTGARHVFEIYREIEHVKSGAVD